MIIFFDALHVRRRTLRALLLRRAYSFDMIKVPPLRQLVSQPFRYFIIARKMSQRRAIFYDRRPSSRWGPTKLLWKMSRNRLNERLRSEFALSDR